MEWIKFWVELEKLEMYNCKIEIYKNFQKRYVYLKNLIMNNNGINEYKLGGN